MKRILPLLLLLLLLSACGEVPLEEQTIAVPAITQLAGGGGEVAPHSIGETPDAAIGAPTRPTTGDYTYADAVQCFGVTGSACYEYTGGRLFSFSFTSRPGGDAVQQDFDALLAGLKAAYGNPSASDKETNVHQWSAKKLGVTVTLTGHMTEDAPYASFAVAGNWDMLCHLGIATAVTDGSFDLLGRLSAALALPPDAVMALWGTPTEDLKSESGKRVLTYTGQSFDTYEGNVYLSFYNDRLYSAGYSATTNTDETVGTALFWDFYAKFSALYGDRSSEYALAYAVPREGDGVHYPAQTQYAVWQKKENPFALELVRSSSYDGISVQFSLTANWVLEDQAALDALTEE